MTKDSINRDFNYMLIFQKFNESIISQALSNKVVLLVNTKEYSKSTITKLPLNYNSRLFIHSNKTIFEVYKIDSYNDQSIQILTLCRNEKCTTSKNIWERRKDLHGHKFKTATVQYNHPYVTATKTNCQSKKCFFGIFPSIWFNLQRHHSQIT